MTMEMGLSSLVRRNKLGIMGDDDDDDVSISSDVSSLTSSDDESDDASPSSDEDPKGGLDSVSDLLQQLPFKRGLSKHFQGKSQSFTSLANVVCLQDLEKPQNPYNINKKLKSCKSYMTLSHAFSPSPPTRSASSSKLFKKPSLCSSLSNKPPINQAHHANTKTPQTPLFV